MRDLSFSGVILSLALLLDFVDSLVRVHYARNLISFSLAGRACFQQFYLFAL